MPITEFLSRLPAVACALGLASQIVLMSNQSTEAQSMKPTILLVHGAWADSSSWNGVVDLLLKNGYDVRALPNTLRGLEADAGVVSTYLKPFLDRRFSPVTPMGAPSSASHQRMRRT